MPSKGDMKMLAIVVAGVFAAGWLMNAMRDNDQVNKAINGFDA